MSIANSSFTKVVSFGTGGAFAPSSVGRALIVDPPGVAPATYQNTTSALDVSTDLSAATVIAYTIVMPTGLATINFGLTAGGPLNSEAATLQAKLGLTAVGQSVNVVVFAADGLDPYGDYSNQGTAGAVVFSPTPSATATGVVPGAYGTGFTTFSVTANNVTVAAETVTIAVV
jgi:hypothetical protein